MNKQLNWRLFGLAGKLRTWTRTTCSLCRKGLIFQEIALIIFLLFTFLPNTGQSQTVDLSQVVLLNDSLVESTPSAFNQDQCVMIVFWDDWAARQLFMQFQNKNEYKAMLQGIHFVFIHPLGYQRRPLAEGEEQAAIERTSRVYDRFISDILSEYELDDTPALYFDKNEDFKNLLMDKTGTQFSSPCLLSYSGQTLTPNVWIGSQEFSDIFGDCKQTQANIPPPRLPSMVFVEGGTYEMGCIISLDSCLENNPPHTSTVSDFYMGRHEVTFQEYDVFCDRTEREKPYIFDTGLGRGQNPVSNVSWLDAIAYCNWLSEQHGFEPVYGNLPSRGASSPNELTVNWEANGYRLPTEAEWEYAARQRGENVLFGNGKNIIDATEINFIGDADPYAKHLQVHLEEGKATNPGPRPVGSLKSPNSLGLHDMSGNVREWCWDIYATYPAEHETNYRGPQSSSWRRKRVVRGGSWLDWPGSCRTTARSASDPSGAEENIIGFRLVRIP